MDYAPESITTTHLQFKSHHIEIIPKDEVCLPSDQCNLVATAGKYGLIFVGCTNSINVYECQTLLDVEKPEPITVLEIGSGITHLAVSSDGLTLLVIIVQNDVPHALFYEIRSLFPGCLPQTPFVSTKLNAVPGARVQSVAWNPMDPLCVAIACSPNNLFIVTLKDSTVDTKGNNIPARAVGWSPKGKQLTVGLADGSLALFKPDLTPVRTVPRPPLDELGGVLSITWFTNTEFFICYKHEVEEGAHVLMYVSAPPKGKEPKFLLFEYLCNSNQGPRTAMFYQAFFPEWNTLCVLSSRAVEVGVLGRIKEGGEGWCEYELEEGSEAAMHNINVTEETFALGLAVDFTSQKTFTDKFQNTIGPGPVLLSLSTGGELNIFHLVNKTPDAPLLTSPREALPASGHRTAQQYGGVASSSVILSSSNTTAPFAITTEKPLLPPPPLLPAATLINSSTGGQTPGRSIEGFSSPLPGLQQLPTSIPPTFSLQKAMVSTHSTPTPSPLPPAFKLSKGPPEVPLSVPSMQFSVGNASIATSSPTFNVVSQPQDAKSGSIIDGLKFPSNNLPQATAASGSISQGKPVILSAGSAPVKAEVSATLKVSEASSSIISSSLSRMPTHLPAGKETNESLTATIKSEMIQFEDELRGHISSSETVTKIGAGNEMGNLRQLLTKQKDWIQQMMSTTSELQGEVTQLHSEVLEGFTLLEEAEAQLNKTKNPRHYLSLQSRPLDPCSRKKLEEIRSLYQYLQSQLAEVNTKLHLDWATFTTNRNNKNRSREPPASEALYHALMRCHNLRRGCEKQVDALCDRLKLLHLDSLNSALTPVRNHYDDEDVLINLEKSLRETKLSSPASLLPNKILTPEKQHRLQKVLAQRCAIPVRKCSSFVKVKMNSFSAKDDSSDNPLSLPPGQPLFSSSNLEQSLSSSFGPQTFSTPNRNGKSTSVTKSLLLSKPSSEDQNIHTDGKAEDQTDTQSSSVAVAGDTPVVSDPPTSQTSSSALMSDTPTDLTAAKSGTLSSNVGITADLSEQKSVVYGDSVIKPEYEDITPPHTPDSRAAVSVTTASPLLALSSLVSKVPQTTATDVTSVTSVSLSTNMKPNDANGNQAESGVTPTINFNFKISSTLPLTTVTTSSVMAFASISSPSSAGFGKGVSSLSETSSASGSKIFSPSTEASGVAPSSDSPALKFALKSSVANTASSGGLFSFKPPSSFLSQVSPLATSSSEDTSTTSSFSCSSYSGGLFGTASPSSASVPSSSTPISSTLFNVASNSSASAGVNLFNSSSLAIALASKLKGESAEPAPPLISNTAPVNLTATLPSEAAQGADSAAPSESTPPAEATPLTESASEPEPHDASESSCESLVENQTDTSATTVTSSTSAASSSIFASLNQKSSLTDAGLGLTKDSGISKVSASEIQPLRLTATTSAASLFGSGTSNTMASMFKSTADGTSSGGSLFSTAVTNTGGSLFGGAISASTSGSTLASASTATTVTTTTATGSIFKILNSTTTGNVLGRLSTPFEGNLFINTTANATSTQGSTLTTSGSLFGGNSSTSVPSAFMSSTTSTSGGIFGSASTSSGGLFGTSSLQSSGDTGAEGGKSLVSQSLATEAPSGTQSSAVVITPVLTTGGSALSSGSIFGGGANTSSTAASFGSPASTSSGTTFGQASPFGTASTSTSGSAFSTLKSSGGGFMSATSSAGSSLFAQVPSQISGSVFGQSTQQSSGGSVFNSSTSTGSVFGNSGQTSGSIFGNASKGPGIFGGSSTQSSGTSLFGQQVSSSSGTGGSLFGQVQGETSVFSSSTKQEAATPFGSSSGFGSGGGGGGFFSGLGSKPSEENANKNVFGSTSFGDAKPQTNLFGGSTAASPSFGGSIFGGGTDSGSASFGSSNNGTIAQTGFAVTTPQKSPGGFGTSPTFGGAPSFGSSPGFGSPPKFGTSPTFGGSPAFGSISSPTSGGEGFSNFANSGGSTFGSVAATSSTSTGGFGGFSGQNGGASFGSLAQQAGQQQSGSAFGSGSSAFGGSSSFSAWR